MSNFLTRDQSREVSYSKFLSLILRHNPDKAGIKLDSNGWASVDEILKNTNVSMAFLSKVVASDRKGRYAFNDDKTKIRACQGHSLKVDLDLKPSSPPDVLYHGTPNRNVSSIKRSGLSKMNRHHVHLSVDVSTATMVGERRGSATVLEIDAKSMSSDGHLFFLSDNGVWLTDFVPAKYISEHQELIF